ncbi:hypothetical protein SAMN05880556_108199 [Azospirillum sp. RU38E]|nr:hypothetical protein SAMN05880556_108199 [Azospirillum sp. RU38E]SNS83681.1 hypothetical protein SAMN05880591_108199 [Azospirillum sp. RU37A]
MNRTDRMAEPETGAMDLAAFREMLDMHGAAMRRWPAEQRAAAQSLLTRSNAARVALREAAALDALLDAMPAPQVDAARLDRVVSGALAALPLPGPAVNSNRKPQRPAPSWGRGRLLALLWGLLPSPGWSRAAGLASCTACGLLVGMLAPLHASSASTKPVGATMASHAVEETGSNLPALFLAPYSLESLFE